MSREPKGFDFWCLESCLYQKYGIKELMMVITIPFYQIKLHCLQEMMRVFEGVGVKCVGNGGEHGDRTEQHCSSRGGG